METREIFQANRKSTRRLTEISQRLSQQELSQTLSNGWPVYVTLAHLAVWDQRVIHVLNLAKESNTLVVPSFDLQLNDILTPILHTIPPEDAVKLSINIAHSLDQMLEECSLEILTEMIKVNARLVNRSLHRNNHIDSIEASIKK
ncbi:MAG: hypothetical protein EHM64_12630 [Ignavibacteriae bacterium]|nr:MAG: hypothetical protein EHM64_12630 [Ignavibacteriota bacterium]